MVQEFKNDVASATYINGPRGTECRIDESTGEYTWYMYDGLGSVIGEVGSTGNVTSTRLYDAFGAVNASSGTSTSKQKFCGSLGHTTESDMGGLIYMRARWYDPAVGRFISEDPAGDGMNWYAYCSNNPINMVDYSGKASLPQDVWNLVKYFIPKLGLKLFDEVNLKKYNPRLYYIAQSLSDGFAALGIATILITDAADCEKRTPYVAAGASLACSMLFAIESKNAVKNLVLAILAEDNGD